MRWDGKRFYGDSIEVSWADAKNLFGEGKFADSFKGLGRLTEEGYQDSDIENGYTRGSCFIDFAGYHDWRLPTAAEWRTLQFLSDNMYKDIDYEARKKYKSQLFPYANTTSVFWSATGKRHPSMCEQVDVGDLHGVERIFTKLEIILSKVFRHFNINNYSNSYYTAWTMNCENSLDANGEDKYPVMFVRTL
jgi:hypothetical protein